MADVAAGDAMGVLGRPRLPRPRFAGVDGNALGALISPVDDDADAVDDAAAADEDDTCVYADGGSVAPSPSVSRTVADGRRSRPLLRADVTPPLDDAEDTDDAGELLGNDVDDDVDDGVAGGTATIVQYLDDVELVRSIV